MKGSSSLRGASKFLVKNKKVGEYALLSKDKGAPGGGGGGGGPPSGGGGPGGGDDGKCTRMVLYLQSHILFLTL